MIIQDIKEYTREELLEGLRQVTLKDQPNKCVYRTANFRLRLAFVREIMPAQYYVLRSDLERVALLRRRVMEHTNRTIDILALDGYIRVILDDGVVDVIPPIVETSNEANGKTPRIVVDGMHRLYLALLEWIDPRVVSISGASAPYYAFPIPGDNPWGQVKLYDSLPEGLLKRWPRQENHKQLFRDFDSVFMTRHTRR